MNSVQSCGLPNNLRSVRTDRRRFARYGATSEEIEGGRPAHGTPDSLLGMLIESYDSRTIGGYRAGAAARSLGMAEPNHSTRRGPTESLRARAIPRQSHHHRTVPIQAITAAPIAIHRATLNWMAEAHPSRRCLPSTGVSETVRAYDSGR